ncbi:hypothetical protein [Shigella dysenteriae]|nr:hypothetical protein [Shigella dysenteriae]WNT50759.1 hypothetical protein PWP84_21625 [Shigella dysenteriae]
MNVNAGHERTSKARIIHQIQLIRGITNKRYDEEIANNTTRSHAWKCSKSTAVFKAGSNAGDTTPVP